jgi:cysteine sulfinate desulfinase/cysteine desulfurase-like protein
MGLSEDEAYSSIRLSIGRTTTMDEILLAADMIRGAVLELKSNKRT